MKKNILRRLSRCLTVCMFISTLASVVPNKLNTQIAKADDKAEATVPMYQLSPNDFPAEIDGAGGTKMKLIDKPTPVADVVLPLLEVHAFRPMEVKYHLTWVDGKRKGRGHFEAHKTKIWDERGNPQIGYTDESDLCLYSGGDYECHPEEARTGRDYIGKQQHGEDSNGAKYTFTPTSFNSGVDLETTNAEMLRVYFKGAHPSSKVIRGAFKRYAEQDRRDINGVGASKGKPGIKYDVLENNLTSGKVRVNVEMGKPGKDDPDWIRPNQYYSGKYGDETFNYWAPEKKLTGIWVAHYKGKKPDEIKPKPIIPTVKPLPCGKINHNPYKTKWTNRGRTSNGFGHYDIDLTPTMPHVVGTGKSHSHDTCSDCDEDGCSYYSCNYTTDTFDVTYDLDYIQASGATNDRVGGTGGTVSIRKEGKGLKVDSKGYWQKPEYDVYYSGEHLDGYKIPDEPCHPEGHSGTYDIDWTDPEIEISDQGYHRHIDSLTFDTTVSDNIEELYELTVSGWGTYGSEKAKLANQTEKVRPITYPHIKHEDTNYRFYYKVEDLATNQTTKSFVTSVVREYWKWAHTTYGKNFDTEVPVKFLSNSDNTSLAGFTKSRTIDFDTWRGLHVEVWYKFTSHYNVNFIRVIHYDDPKIPIITADGHKLYPCTGSDEFHDAPPLSNEIGLEVGTDEYVESFGKCTDPKPIRTVDNGDGTITNYYVNGDVRKINKSTGSLVESTEDGYGSVIPQSIEYLGNKTIYHTSKRYRIEITEGTSSSHVNIYDRNDRCVSSKTIQKA